MSLLDSWNHVVTVFPEETSVDRDGNVMLKASTIGVPKRVLIQPMPQSGTSARRAEQDNEGFESEELYRMRFARGDETLLGPASEVEWEGKRWYITGYPTRYNSSPRTAHLDYVIKRN
jgi:hypothetical protein